MSHYLSIYDGNRGDAVNVGEQQPERHSWTPEHPFHVLPPTGSSGNLKRPILLLAWLRLTFNLCVVRLESSHQLLFLFTWNRAAGRLVEQVTAHECRWHVCTHKGRSHYDALPGTMVGWIVISMKVCCRQHFWNNYQPFPVRQAINYTTDKSVIRFPFTIRMNYVYRESFSTKYHKTNKIENNLIVSKAIFLFVKMQPQTCPEP